MKKYFYVYEGQSIGPFTKEELVGKINSETLVWYEGLSEWTKASEIHDLLNIGQLTPPPIPSQEVSHPKKVEVILKKEKKKLITAKSEVATAKEIKSIFYLALISAVFGLIGFLIKSQSENADYSSLLNKFKAYESEYHNLYDRRRDMYGNVELGDTVISKWFENNRNRLDDLYEQSKTLNCYGEKEIGYSGYKMPNQDYTIKKLENRISYGYSSAKSFSFEVFFISIIVLIIGRYAIKSTKWVSDRAS
jgi:hypothetical protein